MIEKPVLPPRFWADLAESRPTGETVAPAVVRSWFDSVWPLMREYAEESKAKRPSLKRRIAGWWARVRPEEITAARERLRVMADERENAQLEAIAESIKTEPRAPASGSLRLVESAGGQRK